MSEISTKTKTIKVAYQLKSNKWTSVNARLPLPFLRDFGVKQTLILGVTFLWHGHKKWIMTFCLNIKSTVVRLNSENTNNIWCTKCPITYLLQWNLLDKLTEEKQILIPSEFKNNWEKELHPGPYWWHEIFTVEFISTRPTFTDPLFNLWRILLLYPPLWFLYEDDRFGFIFCWGVTCMLCKMKINSDNCPYTYVKRCLLQQNVVCHCLHEQSFYTVQTKDQIPGRYFTRFLGSSPTTSFLPPLPSDSGWAV